MAKREGQYIEEHEKAQMRCDTLADACLDAYEESGDWRLKVAADVLRAIGNIDLSRANDAYPMPWVLTSDARFSPTDYPIRCRHEDGRAVILRNGLTPDDDTCKAIAESVNIIRAIQQGDYLKNGNKQEG